MTSKFRIDVSKYEVLAFDMDFTLARYNLEELHLLVFEFLIEAVESKTDLRFNESERKYVQRFARRAEIFDIDTGNIIILNHDGQVCEALHGTKKQLSREEIIQVYGDKREYKHWETARKLQRSSHHVIFTSDFLSPCYLMLALLVDHSNDNDYNGAVRLVFDALTENFSPESFATRKGKFFPNLQDYPKQYLHRLSSSEVKFMKEMKAEGKKLFLMTNSNHDFADLVMRTILGENWTDLFDFILTSAQKPEFFTRNDEFETLNHKWFQNGSLSALRKLHPEADKYVLYFGDDLRTDILSTSSLEHWDNDLVAVIPEISSPEDRQSLLNCQFFPTVVERTYFCYLLENDAKFVVPSFDPLLARYEKGSHGHHYRHSEAGALFFSSAL